MVLKYKARNNDKEVVVKESSALTFFYENVLGRLLLKVLTKPFISQIVGAYLNSFLSSYLIKKNIKKYNIDMNEYEKAEYDSYNAFFTRKLKDGARKIDTKKKSFISPCDSKLLVYKINRDSLFKIKSTYYYLSDLLKDNIYKEYANGYCLIFRLEVSDYHRYCHIDDGIVKYNNYIPGILHTVRPIAIRHYNIYKENCREWTLIKTKNFDDIIMVEVGALLVGKIINNSNKTVFKGMEKGYFEFGGSTIVVLVKENIIDIDDDILKNSAKNIETIVKMGEKIATKKTKVN